MSRPFDGLFAEPFRAYITGIGVLYRIQIDVSPGFFARLAFLPIEAVDVPFVYHAPPEFLGPRVLDVGEAVRTPAEERRGVSVLEAVAQELGYAVHLTWRERGLEADVQQDERMHMSVHVAVGLLQPVVGSFFAAGGIVSESRYGVHADKGRKKVFNDGVLHLAVGPDLSPPQMLTY